MPAGARGGPTLERRAVHLVAGAVLAAPPRLRRTRLVCVEGRAGAGKTTFADALAGQLRRDGGLDVAVLRLDELYEGWDGLPAMATRLRYELVAPLATGRPARVRRWDWARDRWRDTVEILPVDVLVLDGVGCYSRDIDGYVSYLVWLQADAGERRRRAITRDGDALAAHWDAWAADEERVLSHERTRERADRVVDTSTCVRDG